MWIGYGPLWIDIHLKLRLKAFLFHYMELRKSTQEYTRVNLHFSTLFRVSDETFRTGSSLGFAINSFWWGKYATSVGNLADLNIQIKFKNKHFLVILNPLASAVFRNSNFLETFIRFFFFCNNLDQDLIPAFLHRILWHKSLPLWESADQPPPSHPSFLFE